MARLRLTALGIALMLGLAPAWARGQKVSTSAFEQSPAGWTDLLAYAGPQLEGWTRLPIPPQGKLNDVSQWSLDPKTGTLLCKGNGGHEWLRWDKEMGDFVLHVEWRFVPVSAPGGKRYNSGVFARNSEDGKIWHQAQTGDASGGYLFGDTKVEGNVQRVNFSKQARDKGLDKRVRPAGEWNTYEITCKGKDMTLWVNGAVTCEWHDCEVPKGYVGLEAEGFEIEFRNVKVKPLERTAPNANQ
jgi:hypothetical protein